MAFPTWAKWALGIGGVAGGGFLLYKLFGSRVAGAETIVPDQSTTEKITDTLFPGADPEEIRQAVEDNFPQGGEDIIEEDEVPPGATTASSLPQYTAGGAQLRTPTFDVKGAVTSKSLPVVPSKSLTKDTSAQGGTKPVTKSGGATMTIAGFGGILGRSRMRNTMRRRRRRY